MGDRKVVAIKDWPGAGVEGGGNPPHDGGMEARVEKLEQTCQYLRDDVLVIKATHATKTDLANTEATLIKWFLATALGLAALSFAAAKFIP